jgi:hypothetical protein
VTNHPSLLVIDALAARQLDDAEATAHIASCERCRADLEAAEAACARFTRDVFPRTVANIRERRRWKLGLAMLAPVLAAAALAIWFLRPHAPDDDDIRIKGELTFQVFAKRGDAIIPVRDSTRLAPGDQIRFVVGCGTPAYLLVASIDGAGHATIYYPYGGTRSARADAAPTELPGSIVLDASPGPERVFALVSDTPLETSDVEHALVELGAHGADAIRGARTLDVPVARQTSVVFEKVTP